MVVWIIVSLIDPDSQYLLDAMFPFLLMSVSVAIGIARLRQQIDLDTLRYELLAVVDETMQPARASVWLRQRSGWS
jgi:hypothetical protein